jgi:alkanesulfonate monooxygenase SsuD/methylene tetrahydromethanopterin reductase-like flavin-dependent oxidoreductase (luciferase family)
MKIGYFLSSEEWGPRDLVALAAKAERAGFDDLWISDHYQQIGTRQDEFFATYRDQVLPRVR